MCEHNSSSRRCPAVLQENRSHLILCISAHQRGTPSVVQDPSIYAPFQLFLGKCAARVRFDRVADTWILESVRLIRVAFLILFLPMLGMTQIAFARGNFAFIGGNDAHAWDHAAQSWTSTPLTGAATPPVGSGGNFALTSGRTVHVWDPMRNWSSPFSGTFLTLPVGSIGNFAFTDAGHAHAWNRDTGLTQRTRLQGAATRPVESSGNFALTSGGTVHVWDPMRNWTTPFSGNSLTPPVGSNGNFAFTGSGQAHAWNRDTGRLASTQLTGISVPPVGSGDNFALTSGGTVHVWDPMRNWTTPFSGNSLTPIRVDS